MDAQEMTATEPAIQKTWRVATAGNLLTAEFDGQTVVYHTGAGHTHWVSPVAAEVLHQLSLNPQNVPALFAALSELVSQEDLPLLADSLRETFEHLKQLNLIEPT
jgi:PqqD family protein of HPr-rel-A system